MAQAGFDQILSFFFRPVGRISRREYALGTIFIFAIDLALFSLLISPEGLKPGAVFLGVVLGLPLLVGQLVIAAKRCHDMSLPGSFVLLLAVPIIGAVWLVTLALYPGRGGPNAYGPAPQFRSD